ncbi:MAG TPA: hypothetical protein VFY36_07170 [Solirubrobacteraceae bacterium]|nr:hypothetical protein [Solirubrobacteraceae bacterium]
MSPTRRLKPEPQDSGPTYERVRRDLGRLVTDGLIPYNIAENGGELLRLAIVRSRISIADDADESRLEAAEASALTEVLREAVTKRRMPRRKHRQILKYVLPLVDEYIGTPVERRRTAAGEHLTEGHKVIKPGTIRTYRAYEPEALDELARVLIEMETADVDSSSSRRR